MMKTSVVKEEEEEETLGMLFCDEENEGSKREKKIVEEKSASSCHDVPLIEESDIRVAMIGNVDSGKSTLIGVLCSGNLDDGRGLARSKVFTHKHESASGRTSAISHQLIGFTKTRKQVFPASGKSGKLAKGYWEELVDKSSKHVLLIDLCGHRKYLKTTIFGLTGLYPHYAIVLVGSNMGVPMMTKEHIAIATSLKIPIVVVVTKVDIAPPNVFKQTMVDLKKVLRRSKKMPYIVGKKEKLPKAIELINTSSSTCPIFVTSNVTGRGISELREFIAALRVPSNEDVLGATNKEFDARPPDAPDSALDDRATFRIDSKFHITGVGVVVSGTLRRGRVSINDHLLLGPDKVGEFRRVIVRGIHVNRVSQTTVGPGTNCSFNIRAVSRKEVVTRENIRKGMVMLDERYDIAARTTRTFDAEVVILHHQTTCGTGYTPVLHCGVVRQAAEILDVNKIQTKGSETKKKKKKSSAAEMAASKTEKESPEVVKLRTGDRAIVRFKFMYNAEFIETGDPLLFREGHAKGIGKVVRCVR